MLPQTCPSAHTGGPPRTTGPRGSCRARAPSSHTDSRLLWATSVWAAGRLTGRAMGGRQGRGWAGDHPCQSTCAQVWPTHPGSLHPLSGREQSGIWGLGLQGQAGAGLGPACPRAVAAGTETLRCGVESGPQSSLPVSPLPALARFPLWPCSVSVAFLLLLCVPLLS